jgi:hypothetical protein
MPGYDLAFVDSISATPTVRLNLHVGEAGWSTLADGTVFPPPALERVGPQSMLADGGLVASAAYRNRVLTLALMLEQTADPDTAATQLQLLARELDRPGGNFLRYKPDTSAPVFFRTFRSGFEAVDWDPFQRRATVSLLAEPFAYGLRETLSSVATLNNPVGGMTYDIASPKGDVETPLYLDIDGTNGVTGRLQTCVAVCRRGTPSASPFALQAEAMTMGTDTVVQVNSATMSGAGSNYVRTTPGTTSMVTRLSIAAFPTSPSTDARGTYRVFARVKKNTAGDVWDVRLLWGSSTTQVTNDTVRTPASDATIRYIDLGLVQVPAGYDPVTDGLSGTELPVQGVFLAVQAQRVSGAGTLDIDVLLFVPADDRMMMVKLPAVQNTGTDSFILEGGPRPAAYCLNVSGQLVTTQQSEITGTGPMLTPGRANRIYYMRDLGTTASGGDSVTASTTLTPFYFPRYLAPLRPAAS